MTKRERESMRQYCDTVLNPDILALNCDPSPAQYPAVLLRQALDALDDLERWTPAVEQVPIDGEWVLTIGPRWIAPRVLQWVNDRFLERVAWDEFGEEYRVEIRGATHWRRTPGAPEFMEEDLWSSGEPFPHNTAEDS